MKTSSILVKNYEELGIELFPQYAILYEIKSLSQIFYPWL